MRSLTLIAPMIALLATACGKGGESGGPAGGGAGGSKVIKIVSSLPRTGSANAQTTTTVNGIRMAIEEVGGKVGEFTIVYED